MAGLGTLCLIAACGDPAAPALGALEVSVAMTGSDLDPDGFTITVGDRVRSLGIGGSVIFATLDPGSYEVGLGGVAANCTAGTTSRTVQVVGNDTVSTSFPVVCDVRLGAVEVVVETTGADLDADGYRVVIGDDTAAVAADGAVVIEGIREGRASIELLDVADNCAVQGAHPRPVDVVFDDTTRADLSVACDPGLGALRVSVSTTGEDTDPDGYRLVVDGDTTAVAASGGVLIDPVRAGAIVVELLDIAGNCDVEDENPRTIDVPFGETADVGFTVSCVARLGDVRIDVGTIGRELDPDGYRVVVGDDTATVAVNGSVTVRDVPEGTVPVALIDLESNCVVQGEHPRTVDVSFQATTAAAFTVLCHVRLIAFTSERDGNVDVYVLEPGGGAASRISAAPGLDIYPSWSPDGRRLAFYTDRDGNLEVYTMAPDGSGATNLSSHQADDYLPSWTPDGRILFTSRRDGNDEIYVMGADGSDVRRLTNNTAFDGYAAASPDGEAIAFASNRDGRFHIYVMNPAGQQLRRLTSGAGNRFFPAWSPDGARILFTSDATGGGDVYVMDADGGNVTRLTTHSADDTTPAWSHDGARIVFASNRDGDYEVFVMRADGSNVQKLTDNTGFDAFPAWRP